MKELAMRLWGSEAASVLSTLRTSAQLQRSTALSAVGVKLKPDEDEFVLDDVYYTGKFTTRGTSFDAHLRIVQNVLDSYRVTLTRIESAAIRYEQAEGGYKLGGEAMVISFGREIGNLEKFLSSLLNSEAPFRLWGTHDFVDREFAKVWAVDLHTGHKLNVEVLPDSLRIYLPEGSCGNAVMRLYTNLQHFYDSSASLILPDHAENLEPHIAD